MKNTNKMSELKIGDLIAKLPIIQGGMGIGVSLNGLSSAVANEGGIGVISAACIGFNENDFTSKYLEANIRALQNEIRKAKEKTRGIIGVNVMVALSNFSDMVKTSINEKADIIFAGAGLALNIPMFLKEGVKTKLVPIVSSARAAHIIIKKWLERYNYAPDAIVVEGPRAGGHLGFTDEQLIMPNYSLEQIVPNVIRETKNFEHLAGKSIPVIAAGGIYSGEDIYKFIKLGVQGVQMATRFVTTLECDASLEFKQAYINATKEDFMIIKSPVGMPGRALKNKFINDVNLGIKKPFSCPFHCITTCDYQKSPYCISMALINAQKGLLNKGFVFAGANAYKADKIISVNELVENLKTEYNLATSML